MLGNKLVVVLCVAILSISWIQAALDLKTNGTHSRDLNAEWRAITPDLTSGLMTGGIYTQDQIDEWQKHINSQGREPLRVPKTTYSSDSSATVHRIDNKPAEYECSRAWDKFIPFCIVCVGIIATFFCIKTVILAVKAIITVRGRVCHRDKSEERDARSSLASGTELNAKADVEKGTGEK